VIFPDYPDRFKHNAKQFGYLTLVKAVADDRCSGSNVDVGSIASYLLRPCAAVNATLYDRLNFDFIRDFAPIATLIRQPLVMVVHPSFPAKTVPEFIAYAKANPSKISFASAGNGTPSHLAGESFKMMANVDMIHIPYRGGAPAVTDLIDGRVQALFISALLSNEHIIDGGCAEISAHLR